MLPTGYLGKKQAMRLLWVIVKNGLPFVITAVTAYTLLTDLGTEKKIGLISLDAFQWPGLKGTGVNQATSLTPGIGNPDPARPLETLPALQAEVIHAILVFTAFTFVAWNTLIFVLENVAAFRRRKSNLLYLPWFLATACLIVTTVWLPKVYEGWHAEWIATFPDEMIALWIFSCFFFVDCINYKVYADGTDEDDLIDSRSALNQAFLVDLPVIAGIAISIYLAGHLNQHFGEADEYLSGFFSGATVMHLAASQIIYSILAVRRDLAKVKLVLEACSPPVAHV